MKKTLLCLFAAISLWSCEKQSSEPEYLQHQQKWEALRLTEYTIKQRLLCGECSIDGRVGFVTVTVRNNLITDVRTADGTSLPSEKWGWYETVDGLFEIIRNTSPDKGANLHVTYDDRFCYPTVLEIRSGLEVMNDELFRETKELAY